MAKITVKTSSLFRYSNIASVEINKGKVSDESTIWANVNGIGQSIPDPNRGVPFIRLSFYGPRKGPKDSATFTKAQAMEMGHALLTLAGEPDGEV